MTLTHNNPGMKIRTIAAVISLIGVFILSLAPSCYVSYLFHIAWGECKMLLQRQPVEVFLTDPQISDNIKAKLVTIQKITQFGRDHLGLNVDLQYSTFSPNVRDIYSISAAPKDSLLPYVWYFPLVRSVPYLGFFSSERVATECQRLTDQDLDTYIRPVTAFSTLGWFDDPILPGFLNYNEITLANLVLHELAHATVYFPGQTEFNENLASFVGEEGCQAYLIAQYGRDADIVAEAKNKTTVLHQSTEYVKKLQQRLELLYNSAAPRTEKIKQRQIIFESWLQDIESNLPVDVSERLRGRFVDREMNNAVLLSLLNYQKDLSLFDQIHEQLGHDLPKTIMFLKSIPADTPDAVMFLGNKVSKREMNAEGR